MAFSDKINFDLTITCGRNSYTIPPDYIQSFKASLNQFGFTAEVGFWVDVENDDADLFSGLIGQDPCEVRLALQSVIKVPTEKADPILVRGPITSKSIEEYTFLNAADNPVLYRYFELSFADAAAVFWKQHFPSELLVEATVSDLLDLHAIDGIELYKLWTSLLEVRDIVALHLPHCEKASFYDFVMWFTDTNDGSFSYDSQGNCYYLTDYKQPGLSVDGLSYTIIEKLKILQPNIPRHEVNVLNSYSDDSQKSKVEQSYSVQGIRRDYIMRTPVSSEYSGRKTLESSRLTQPGNRLSLEFNEFPWIPLSPGTIIKMQGEGNWPENLYFYGTEMRVDKLHIECQAETERPTAESNNLSTKCTMNISIELEERLDMCVNFPDYTPPTQPLEAEGVIISEVGEDSETSFNVYTNDDTSLDYYMVKIPLWNKDVPVLFESDFLPPHFFFPAYKDARVLITMTFEKAEIRRFLEFGPRVRLPMDGQGNHLLMGFNETSQTSISHSYVDSSPILDISRTTEGENELIRFSDGTILIQTTADESEIDSSSGTDLTPRADAAVADLTLKSQAGVADATAVFDDANDEVNGELSNASSDCESAMDDAESLMNDKMSEATTIIDEALSKVSETTAAMQESFSAAQDELKLALTL